MHYQTWRPYEETSKGSLEPERSRLKHKSKIHAFEIVVQGRRLQVQQIAREDIEAEDEHPELVLLHEGLGSISLWKNFPAKVAASTQFPAAASSPYHNR